MRMLVRVTLALLTTASIGGLPAVATAQFTELWQRGPSIAGPRQNGPTVERPNAPNKREEFRMMLQQYQDELDQLSRGVADVSKRLEAQSGASIEAGRARVDALRQQLVRLGAQLQPGAPLMQNTERFQSWMMPAQQCRSSKG
jgi:hypothetical protein